MFAALSFCAIFCFAAFDGQISLRPGSSRTPCPEDIYRLLPSAPSLGNPRVLLTGGWIAAGWGKVFDGTQPTMKCIPLKERIIALRHDQHV